VSGTATATRLSSHSERRHADLRASAWFAGGSLLAGVAAVGLGTFAAAAVVAVALMVLTAMRPVVAVYVYLATLPFLAGIDRDRLLPFLRPNEALLVLLLAGVLAGAYLRYLRGDEVGLRVHRLDVPLGVFVLLSTLWPITWMLMRGDVPGSAELTALLPICKLTALLILIRATVRSDAQLLPLGRVIMWPAAAIAVVAVLQTLSFPPVVALLNTYWRPIGSDPSGVVDRGSTTLASSIATGDYIVIALALLVAMIVRDLVGRREQMAVGLTLTAGTLAAGQFSTWASAAVVTAAMLYVYPRLRRRALRLLPALGVAVLVGLPAFVARLAEFGDSFGVPRSWLGRWDNLVNFYLPALGEFRWILGVSPNSVLQAPETWREVIYLEYGYLQLLWVGGVPLLAAFAWLSIELLRQARRMASLPEVVGAYASALWAAWWMVLLLSVIDIHLVLRGAGELLFTFIAITTGKSDDR